QQRGILGLSPIPVHLLAEVGDEGTGRQRNAVIGIECRSAAHPPRPAEHGDESVVRVEVGRGGMVALEPLVEDDVMSSLRRVAHEHRVLRAGGAWWIPFDLVGKFVGEGRRVELSRIAGHRQAERKCRSGEQQAAQAQVSGHSFLRVGNSLELESIDPLDRPAKRRSRALSERPSDVSCQQRLERSPQAARPVSAGHCQAPRRRLRKLVTPDPGAQPYRGAIWASAPPRTVWAWRSRRGAAVSWGWPAGSLPSVFPGFEAGSTRVHVKHGLAAAAVAVVLFAIAWYAGRSRARGASRASVTPPSTG